ncbi:TadE/TadG family type IV pilus assembly protein [Sphingobium sp.]|uniref:TadE/TadG family type IV pilus assembly protein n=1 Tax=Sphingobium sp. TaxID=1912891 RepID=UPI003BB75A05
MIRAVPIGKGTGLWRNSRGATIVEFAAVAPVLVLMLMFLFDTGFYILANSILGGEVNAAGRNATLETANDDSRKAMDDQVTAAVERLIPKAAMSYSRLAYKSYGRAQAKAESYNDLNADGVCNNNEPFDDANRNNVRDLDSGTTGGGSARDVVIYTATLKYDRLFPIAAMLGWNNQVTMSSSTILRNQPFDKQPEPLIGHCA